ncbi:hypothetical protein L9F63_006750, partial [Diploptera punctata]
LHNTSTAIHGLMMERRLEGNETKGNHQWRANRVERNTAKLAKTQRRRRRSHLNLTIVIVTPALVSETQMVFKILG